MGPRKDKGMEKLIDEFIPPREARKRNSLEQPRETSPSKKRSPSPEKEEEVTDVISINEFEQAMKKHSQN